MGVGWFGLSQRGPILPEFGYRERDRVLRDFDRHNYNALWQGATAGFLKKISSTPWEIKGDSALTAYYQELLQGAQFGDGWGTFIKRFGRDFLAQDFGGLVEIIGPGDPMGPLTGSAVGLAHLDSLRCFATGNLEHPIIYFSQITGKLHKLHYTRVARMVDMPDPDERMYGTGLSALSRYIAIAQQEILMNRYLEQRLDDKPPPGIMTVANLTDTQMQAAVNRFLREQTADQKPIWGQTLMLYGIDPSVPITVTPTAFAQAPEKFDYKIYTELHINALALALGVDKQELWELGGGSLGSGQQSQVLAMKARGKGYGDFLAMLERFINIHILPDGLEFAFKYKDEQEEQSRADNDAKYVAIAQQMQSMGIFSAVEIRSLLVDKSETFQQILTNQQGQVQASDDDQIAAAVTETTAPDTAPVQAEPTATPFPAQKDYPATRASFTANLIDLMRGGLQDEVSRRRFGIVMRAQLRRAGQSAYEDGLREGGVDEPIDEDGLAEVQGWLADQSDYVTKFANELFKQGLSPAEVETRSTAWANKSLDYMLNAGRLSADKNGLYEFAGADGKESCKTCQRLRGQRHRLKDWNKKKLIPRRDTASFDCGGWECKHQLVRVTGKALGSW